jgi:hypothetical protein
VDKSTGLRSDQTIVLTGAQSPDRYPDQLRRVTVRDTERGRKNWGLTPFLRRGSDPVFATADR